MNGMTEDILDENSYFESIYREIDIGLDPKFIGNEERAIDRIINNMKYKYNYELKGVLLDYSHLKFMSDFGRIIDDQPLVYWKIGANFKTFNATVGHMIKAKINRMGTTYCGALVGGCIDATILLAEDVSKEELMPYLKLDQEIIFRINGFDPSLCFIDGMIDEKCFEKMKELIELNDEFNGNYKPIDVRKAVKTQLLLQIKNPFNYKRGLY